MTRLNEEFKRLEDVANELVKLIKKSPSKFITEGILYTMVIDRISLEQYNQLIGILKETGKIKEVSYNVLQVVEEKDSEEKEER